MALDATVGGSASNAYVSVAEATTLLQDSLHVEPWYTELPPPTAGYQELSHRREAALIQATALLDQYVHWRGSPTTPTQALGWPQTGAVDQWGRPIASDIVPTDIKRATATYAVLLMEDATSQSTGANSTQAVRRRKIGGMEIEYQQQTAAAPAKAASKGLPTEVRALLRPYGAMLGGVTIALIRA